MKITIKTTNLKLDRSLKNFVEEKINSLEKFSKIFQKKYFSTFFSKAAKGEPRQGRRKPVIEAWVEIGKTTLHHKKGPFFRAECQIKLSGKSIRSTAQSKDLRLAITEVKNELQRQLKQYKNKLQASKKRKGRVLKKFFHFSSAAKFKRRKGARIREEGI